MSTRNNGRQSFGKATQTTKLTTSGGTRFYRQKKQDSQNLMGIPSRLVSKGKTSSPTATIPHRARGGE